MLTSHKVSIKSLLRGYFTLIVTIYPLCNRYLSPIPRVALVEVLLFAFWIMALMTCGNRVRFAKAFLPLCIYLALQLGLALYTASSSLQLFDIFGSTLRLIFMYMTLAMFTTSYFDFGLGVKLVRFFATCSSIYALVQIAAFKFFGIYLSSYLLFLPISDLEKSEISGISTFYFSSPAEFRPWSFFSEPSILGTYLVIALILELFLQRRHWICYSVLFCVVCFAARTSTGIILVIFTVGVFFCKRIQKANKRMFINCVIMVAIFAAGAVLFVSKSDIWAYFVRKTFAGRGVSIIGLVQSGRFDHVGILEQNATSLYKFLFGMGFVGSSITEDAIAFLPGFAHVYYSFGSIGLALYIGLCWHFWRHSTNDMQRMIAFVYLIYNIAGDSITSIIMYTIVPFLLAHNTVKVENRQRSPRMTKGKVGRITV